MKTFETPVIDVIRFNVENIMAASGGCSDDICWTDENMCWTDGYQCTVFA